MQLIPKLNLSLTTKLIVTSAVVEAILLTFLIWDNVTLAQKRLTQQKEQEIIEFATFISSTLVAALVRNDKSEIQEIVTHLSMSPNVKQVSIKSPDNETITQINSLKQVQLNDQEFASFPRSAFYKDIYPLDIPLTKNDITLGYLHLEFSTKDLSALLKGVRDQGIAHALIILAVTITVLYLLLSVLTRNIKTLTVAMTEYIDHQQISTPITYSNDEVGVLGKTFKKLIDTISHADDALKESNHILQSILDNSPGIIFSKDTDGRYLLANSQFARFLNTTADEILGKTDFELFPDDIAKRFQLSDQKVLSTRSIDMIEQIVPYEGELKTYITTKFCLFDKHNNAYAICGISTDISDRIRSEQRLKESEENLRSLANNAIDGILVNKKGKHVFTNQRMAEILNTTIQDIMGSDQDFVLHPSEKDNVVQRFKRRLKGQNEPIRYETAFVDKHSGEPVPVELTAFISQWDGEPSGVVFVRDIKERKKTEAELKRYREQLEQMVSGRTAELENAIKELESFSYSVSHDLRSPLRSIDGFSQILLEDYQDRLDETGINYLTRVRKAAQRMAQLIDDILLLSRVSRHKLSIGPVNLRQIAEESAITQRDLYCNHHVDISIAHNMQGRGDQRLLRIVIDNLLENACKYTSKQEHAEVHFGTKLENGTTIYFVKDNGVGFDMRYADKLFGAFQRLHGADEFPGTGIGLATVKRIIDRHGGKIWAEGQPRQGATFYFTLA
jgi:PAS domain S-box-containing protein